MRRLSCTYELLETLVRLVSCVLVAGTIPLAFDILVIRSVPGNARCVAFGNFWLWLRDGDKHTQAGSSTQLDQYLGQCPPARKLYLVGDVWYSHGFALSCKHELFLRRSCVQCLLPGYAAPFMHVRAVRNVCATRVLRSCGWDNSSCGLLTELVAFTVFRLLMASTVFHGFSWWLVRIRCLKTIVLTSSRSVQEDGRPVPGSARRVVF
ncbi:hypothetical protein NEOLEDRAFT_339565 [Neolentinus lepideus HHB14362 ss-1]|uniref:Uncharacterized protein n=1 Tax=Neolentinus lepideus HHB14362 ss-1 TaxID=1314782 RepID=A0A165SWH0_9AGAM|nr:hypothetical protein NEOLEDRAFT_339565 [Neolentinus lepideus HHB14362 ss-1]